jgi:hypothetical protein
MGRRVEQERSIVVSLSQPIAVSGCLVVQKSRERLVYGESQCETGVTE